MICCCRDCKGFVFDTIGNGYGIGQCRYLVWAEKKGLDREQILMELGQPLMSGSSLRSDVFWGGTETRDCEYFKGHDSPSLANTG